MKKTLLKKYQEKRRFQQTPEPTGEEQIDLKENIFVVQKHQASHLHYDFRLSIDGILKCWAIPKGPSLNPRDKRLAVMTEDHPLAYANFEGVIPEGEYGAGTVMIWDQGSWESIGDPRAGLKNKKLEFKLYGKKLQGAWVLLGFKGETNNWLLIKKRDQSAISSNASNILDTPSVLSGKSMGELSSGKN